MAAALATRPGHLIAGQFLVDIEAHVSELQADVGVQLLSGDVVQQLVIELSAGAGFVGVGDVLAEIVDGDAQAGLVYGASGPEHVFDLSAGNKTAGEVLADGGTLGDGAQPVALRERDEERPQHRTPTQVEKMEL